MTGGPEFTEVEEPFLDQLVLMGWKMIMGSVDHPSVTGRESFREVFMKGDLRKAIERINLKDGKPWLDGARISQAASALERIGHKKLIEANQEATELLLSGVQVDGLPGWDGGRARTVHFIDWDNVENNTFMAISQYKVDCPVGQAKGSMRPDITLLINGIPVVVVECKSPGIAEPIAAAVDQLRRYHNARKEAGEVEEAEGQRAALLHESVSRCDELRRSPRGSYRRRCSVLPGVEGYGAGFTGRGQRRARQGTTIEPEQTDRGDASPRAPARHHPAFHALQTEWRQVGQNCLSLPAVPRSPSRCAAIGQRQDAKRGR